MKAINKIYIFYNVQQLLQHYDQKMSNTRNKYRIWNILKKKYNNLLHFL